MRFLVALASVVLALGVRADTADDVRRLDHDSTVATWTGDVVWFEANLADDYVLITPGGAVRTKREFIREMASPSLRMEPYDPTEVHVRVYGDTAIVTGRAVQKFTLGNNRYTNDRRYTNIYVKRKSRWILVSGHSSSVRR
ncbi:MAG: nuclear transport factor 2 family protein [Acidobacteriota bacterium]